MQDEIKQWLSHSLKALCASGVISETAAAQAPPQVTRTKTPEHGDYASNIALALAADAGCAPRQLAQRIVEALPSPPALEKVEIAGPGFINFHLKEAAVAAVVGEILAQAQDYGRAAAGSRGRALVEFVSANPTGPLHIGHGRGAAYGATLANLLEAAGYTVEREYYVNDQGRQADILALSVWLRYLELCGEEDVEYPAKAYQGDYIWDVAAVLHRAEGARLRKGTVLINPAALPQDPEERLDALIEAAKTELGAADYAIVLHTAIHTILDSIKDELHHFGVDYDRWFQEKSLADNGEIAAAIARLKDAGHLYDSEGAQWFRSTSFGDDKDRVLVRANGHATYFAADVAYHLNKYERGYDLIVNVWGADHHGYVARIEAALKALSLDAGKLRTVLVQFVNLYRGDDKAGMSTRGGEFVPLAALRKEIGADAARLFYVMRKYNRHVDIDIQLARSRSSDNPVYYIQYAHARVCSLFAQARARGFAPPAPQAAPGALSPELLTEDEESDLLKFLARYPGVVRAAAAEMEPYSMMNYLKELAGRFHVYYNRHQFLVADGQLRAARLALAAAVRQLLQNGLGMLGVSAPEKM
ncbi:MAG: arginine--tRNA ligase [Gammaproteobacteria bacterium]|nr:arginine--tRNA ligase [Gammaproteobacteria bacterium]MDD9869902.1 arginine--tRNA ligase [Gammaproteobacteria bacterium]